MRFRILSPSFSPDQWRARRLAGSRSATERNRGGPEDGAEVGAWGRGGRSTSLHGWSTSSGAICASPGGLNLNSSRTWENRSNNKDESHWFDSNTKCDGYDGITHLFHLVKNTQEVLSQDTRHFLFGPLPAQQFLDEDGILGDIF